MSFEVFGQPVVAWQLFAAMGIIFAFLEAFVPGFVLLPIGVAMMITAPMTVFSDYWVTHLGVFGVVLILTFILMNKYVKPKSMQTLKSNVDSMVGKIATVTEPVSINNPGYVKLYGDRWQATTKSEEPLAIDEKVVIKEVDGNKVVVSKQV